MYATLFAFVGRNLINSSMRGKDAFLGESGKLLLVIGHKIWVFPLPIIRLFNYFIYNRASYTWSNFGPHTWEGGGGYWRRRFHRLVHMGVLCSAPAFSALLIYVPICETQQVTNYPHNLQHYTKYLVLYVLFYTIPTIEKKSRHFRLVPLDILSDPDNFEGYTKSHTRVGQGLRAADVINWAQLSWASI